MNQVLNTMVLAIGAAGAFAFSPVSTATEAQHVITKIRQEVVYKTAPRSKEFWYQMIDHYSDQFDVPKDWMRVIFMIESTEGVNTYAFNPHKLRAAALRTGDNLDQKMLASALCPFQVLGLTADSLHVSWQEIAFDPQECVRTAVYYVRTLKDRHEGLEGLEATRMVFRDYYGKSKVGEAYSREAMGLLADMRKANAKRNTDNKRTTKRAH